MTTTHPEQIMLPGQTFAAEGPVDMTVMYVMHHGFRRDLRRFAETVPATPLDDHEAWTALNERWGRFSEILHHHHSGEDAGIWPFLLERAQPAERQTLLDMEAEHEKIDPLLQRCAEGFAALATTGQDREALRAGLAVRLAEAQELLSHHLRHEETGALPLLQRYMTSEEWTQIDEEHFKGDNRLGFLLFVVNWVAEELPKSAMDRAFAEAGQAFRVLLFLGRRNYRKLNQKAFRHLPASASVG